MRLPELQNDDRDQEVEVRGTVGGLKRHQVDAPLPKPFVRLKSHSLKADKEAPRQPFCGLLWHRENSRADSQKLILANAITRHQSLCQEL